MMAWAARLTLPLVSCGGAAAGPSTSGPAASYLNWKIGLVEVPEVECVTHPSFRNRRSALANTWSLSGNPDFFYQKKRAHNIPCISSGEPDPRSARSARNSKLSPAQTAEALYQDLARYGLDDVDDMSWPATSFGSSEVGRDSVPKKGGLEGMEKRQRSGENKKVRAGKAEAASTTVVPRVEGSKGEESTAEGNDDERGWCVYCLLSRDAGKTYVGVSTDVDRRLQQHNGQVPGGASSTRVGRPWQVLCVVSGFTSRSAAFQFEWRWKNPRPVKGDGSSLKYPATEAVGTPSVVTRRKWALGKAFDHFPSWEELSVAWESTQEAKTTG